MRLRCAVGPCETKTASRRSEGQAAPNLRSPHYHVAADHARPDSPTQPLADREPGAVDDSVANCQSGALQLVKLRGSTVQLVPKTLATLQQNLVEAKCESVSFVSIMGRKRQGKSFMMDLFRKYLAAPREFREAKTEARARESFRIRGDPDTYPTPAWARADRGAGFQWRGGEAACTTGVNGGRNLYVAREELAHERRRFALFSWIHRDAPIIPSPERKNRHFTGSPLH